MKYKFGFTLTELLVVVAIIGTLAVVGTPIYLNHKNTALQRSAAETIRVIMKDIHSTIATKGLSDNPATPLIVKSTYLGAPYDFQVLTADCPPPANGYILKGTSKVIHQYEIGTTICSIQIFSCYNKTNHSMEFYLSAKGRSLDPLKNSCVNKMTENSTNDDTTYNLNILQFISSAGLTNFI